MAELTPYQKQIIELLKNDLSSKEVAVKLNLEPTNVSTCLATLRKNFKTRTTHGLLLKLNNLK